MEISNLLKIEYHGKRVLTTGQIAEGYGCTPENIRWNYQKNPGKFIEGVHYFKLEGEELKAFKYYVAEMAAENSRVGDAENFHSPQLPISKLASSLILWTKEGAIRHCKMLNTKKAWEMFSILEKAYFNSLNETPQIKPAKIKKPKIRKPKIKDSLSFEQLLKLIEYCTNENLRDDLIRKAAGNLEPLRCVYILALSDGTVKIGMTQDFQRRAREILNQTGLTVKNWCHTSYLPTEIAREIEIACLEHFDESQTEGEFFNIEFETATNELSKHVEIAESMNIL